MQEQQQRKICHCEPMMSRETDLREGEEDIYRDTLGKEEILSEVASEGFKSPGLVQELLPHQGRHPCQE